MRLALLAVLFTSAAFAQPTAYVGGQWFDGERFEARDTTWAEGGVFVDGPLVPTRVVELGGAFVVPPFGDSHLHALYEPGSIRSTDSLLVARGVFYVRNPHVTASDRDAVREIETVVDVTYAVGAITTAASHLSTAFEARALGLQPWDVWGPRGDEIRASRRAEGDAYHLAPTVADLDTVWPRVRASGTDVLKVILNHTQGWATGNPAVQRGISPEVLVVRRAHADGLHVVAHIETAADVRAGLAAGVDAFAHAPGYTAADPETDEGGAFALDDGLIADWAEAAGDYTMLHTRGKTYLTSQGIGALADRLDPARFARVHRSTIVALDALRALERDTSGGFVARLVDGAVVRVSRTYADTIRDMIA